VVKLIDAEDKIFPTKALVEPIVAELPEKRRNSKYLLGNKAKD
jgi:hypothetical protein